MGQVSGKVPHEERYNGRTPKEHALHTLGAGMLEGIDEVFKAADMPDEGTFDPRWWAKVLKKGEDKLKKKGLYSLCVKWKQMCDMKELEEACTPEEWVSFQNMGTVGRGLVPQPLGENDSEGETQGGTPEGVW